MDQNRKNIIINEIIYWKEHRMLPEQYCDYLLALYSEGNHSGETARHNKISLNKANVISLVLIPFSLLLIYFTELSFNWQILILIIFIFIPVLFTLYYLRKGILMQIPAISSALLILLGSVELVTNWWPKQTAWLYITVLCNCIFWILFGRKFKLLYFTTSGLIGIGILVVSVFL